MATNRLGGQFMVCWPCALGFGEPDSETLSPLALVDRVRVVLVERAEHVRGTGDLLDQLAPGGTGGIGLTRDFHASKKTLRMAWKGHAT